MMDFKVGRKKKNVKYEIIFFIDYILTFLIE